MTLTLASTTTVRGRGIISSDLHFGGTGTIINQGLISADVAGQTLTVNPDTFTNQGTAQAINGATLTIGATNWNNSTGVLLVNNGTLNLDGTFTNPGAINRTGGTINVTGTWNNTGNSYLLSSSTGDFRLNGGTIRGGTINQDGGALRFSTSGSNILDAVTITGAMQLSESSAFVRLMNGATFSQADLTGASSRLLFEGTAATPSSTLSGALINLDASNAGFGLSGNMTLTLASTTTVRGRGIISSDLHFGGTGTIINQGLISADVTGQTLTVNPDTFTNQGTAQAINGATLTISATNWNNSTGVLLVNNGTLNLDGTFTNPGAINRTGGTINITGTWNNTGNSYLLSSSTGDFRLNGGTIRGGTVNQDGGALRFSASGSNILDAVTITGAMQLSESSAFVRLMNGATFSQADLTGASSRLLFEGTAATPSSTLSGATINLEATNAGFGLSGNMTLTLASTTTVRGRGIISSDLHLGGTGTIINQGNIFADLAGTLTINPDVFTNQGLVQAFTGSTLTISATTWSNPTGTLSVINSGVLNLDGTFTSPGTISRDGGTINITGLWNNAGQTYALTASTGDFRLNGGTIQGGTINQSANGSLRFASSGSNILDGVTINGPLQLSESSSFVRLLNGTTFTQANLTGSSSRLLMEGSTGANPAVVRTLTGAAINLDAAGAGFGLSGNITLTLGSTTTVRGRGIISSDMHFGGAGTLINQGTIVADLAGQTLTVNPDSFTNQGTARATGGATLTFNTVYTQTAGTLEVSASTISSNSALQIQGGLLTGFGTINAAISNNAMLRPSLGAGGLNVNGNVSLLAGSSLIFQLGGLVQNTQYAHIGVNGTVSLGGNLVLTFVNGFGGSVTGNDNFTLMNSNAALTGAFANVASGTRLTTSDGSGSFVVNYNGNALAIGGFAPTPAAVVPAAAAGGAPVGAPLPDAASAPEQRFSADDAPSWRLGRGVARVGMTNHAPVVAAEPSIGVAVAPPAVALAAAAASPSPASQTPAAAVAPVPHTRMTDARAQNLTQLAQSEMQRPVRDASRRFGVQVRDSDQLLSLIENGVEEQTTAGRSSIGARRGPRGTPEAATQTSVGSPNPTARPADVAPDRALAPSRLGIRSSVVPD
jgi:hypothetical protein